MESPPRSARRHASIVNYLNDLKTDVSGRRMSATDEAQGEGGVDTDFDETSNITAGPDAPPPEPVQSTDVPCVPVVNDEVVEAASTVPDSNATSMRTSDLSPVSEKRGSLVVPQLPVDELEKQFSEALTSGTDHWSVRAWKALRDETVIGVFVVHFDTLKGNIVEWSLGDVEFEGVEYKAMPSGVHAVSYDLVYFRQYGAGHGAYHASESDEERRMSGGLPKVAGGSFGMASFNKLTVESAAERGARMRSVGLFSRSYNALPQHIDFLQGVARELNNAGEHVTDEHFNSLRSFFEEQRQPRRMEAPQRSISSDSGAVPDTLKWKARGSPGSFSHLVQFFGINIFILWKALLLRKRVLFYTPVPLASVCERVHSACSLTFCSKPLIAAVTEPNPLFYVNVADIDELVGLSGYVACTTERIFSEKPELYDVFVNNQNVVVNKDCERILKLTKGDHRRLTMLTEILDAHRRTTLGPSSPEEKEGLETELQSCFTYLNDLLFHKLVDASRDGRHLEPSELPEFGLHKGDRRFLEHLIAAYRLHVELLQGDQGFCNIL